MALSVTFVGTSPIPTPGSSASYKIWSYKIEGTVSEISTGLRLALALPDNLNIQDPSFFPDVPDLAGTFVTPNPELGIQYVGRTASSNGSLTIAFVAPARTSSGKLLLYKSTPGENWVSIPFSAVPNGTPSHEQFMPIPAPGAPVYTGRPVHDFAGTIPYASELFGVYQPLAGWSSCLSPAASNVLSPIGKVNLFREYFFEFDTFLGKPAGHIWVSPGGTVEVIETSTRRTLIEKVAEQSEEISQKTEQSITEQDDVADAIKEDNSNDTKLGVSATGGVSAPIYHADVSASFSSQNTVKKASEAAHKRTRTQTAKFTSEIKRNFRTSFKTVTENTDTSSRRYVLQNIGNDLINYEMRRKMRKVGVQLQHVGTRLCWQVYIGDPGRDLGLGDMVHVVESPDLTAIKKPEKLPTPANKEIPFHFDLPFLHDAGADDEAVNTYTPHPDNECRGLSKPDVGVDNTIQFCFEIQLPPVPTNYVLSKIVSVDHHGAQVNYKTPELLTELNKIKLQLTYANFQGRKSLPFDFLLLYVPSEDAKREVDNLNNEAEDAYQKEVSQLQHEAYGKAVRERLRLVSSMRARPADDLRSEERRSVFRNLIQRLQKENHYPKDPESLPYLESERIQQFFDVDEMLYFVAPDFWRPVPVSPAATKNSVGRYPIPPKEEEPLCGTKQLPLSGQTVAGWYSRADEYKNINSAVAEEACLTITSAPTSPNNITITLNGLAYNVAVDPAFQKTAADVATLIRNTSFPGWKTNGTGANVTFNATFTGPMTDATYSAGSTGAAGTMTTTIQGASIGQEPPGSEWRVNYLITEQTQPAPMGSSLGWLIQMDGDERRNEFLNSAWVKAVLPIRPGQEADALAWIKMVEGEAAFNLDYCYQEGDPQNFRDKKVGQVLEIVAEQLKESNTQYSKTLASEKVFETGFDPLDGGFRPAEPYQVFDQWIEILPTDQVAAVAVRYDPKTGQQI
ncbi:hypothetical protein BK749_11410 [Bacillus thuringiensis serovar vazensis]|uniref:Uncharacterized protein n=1 Tax=Bacillus thuringiensis serovar vazensis TaxID=180867 RepID=A0A243D004_BACTU|nr:hypothetical protein [Bacillus thuringiensis]EEM86178.1 hypothetical protein bthur0012_58220 [Bacillus thuringiensis serovar pulsiensis BGSC 4CC1]OTY76722.1 hypothetical protein BK749_11410 [Bacillus thuringiensis serovar vazensis]